MTPEKEKKEPIPKAMSTPPDDYKDLIERLISWAQNEEMVDNGYTQLGHDLNKAAAALSRCESLEAALYVVSVQGLQTEGYWKDMDFRDAVDDGIALTKSRFAALQERGG